LMFCNNSEKENAKRIRYLKSIKKEKSLSNLKCFCTVISAKTHFYVCL